MYSGYVELLSQRSNIIQEDYHGKFTLYNPITKTKRNYLANADYTSPTFVTSIKNKILKDESLLFPNEMSLNS